MPKSALQRRLLQQAVVAELGLLALEGAEPQALAEYAVSVVTEALATPMAGVLELNNGWLVLQSGAGLLEEAGGTVLMQATDTHARETLSAGEPVVLGEEVPVQLAQRGIVAGVSVRLGGAGEQAGMVGAYSNETHEFDAEDRAFLAAVAAVLAGAREQTQTAQALKESEARARAILNTTVDGVVTINEDAIIETFNPAAEQIFGYTEEEVVGKNVHVLMPEPYHSEHDGYVDAYKRTGQRRIIGIGREVFGKRKDGSTFPLDLAVGEVVLPNRRIFTGILRDITERRELENAVLSVAEEERRRIGQDLHDGLGQMLTGTGLIARGLSRKLKLMENEASEDANEVVELIKEADAYARTISRGLVPVELATHGLDDALERLVSNSERLFTIDCTFEVRGVLSENEESLPKDVSPHLFRIAQEAISNAAFHGKASTVAVILIRSSDWLSLRIKDDGIGFPGLIRSAGSTRLAPVPGEREKSTENRGMGVRIMHYRARIIGGALEIRLDTDGGTVVTCSVPLGKDRQSEP